MLPLCGRRSPAAPAAPMAAHARARAAPCCLPRSPAAILDTQPRPPMRARVRGAACRLDTSPELSTVPAGDPSGGDPGHVQTAPAPAAIPGGLLPNCPDGPRRAHGRPWPRPRSAPRCAAPLDARPPRHAPRHHAGATRPRMQPLRGCFYRATRNASALRIRAPLRPCVTRRVPPRAPAPLRSRRAARSPARACTRAPASACRYCARHFPLSRAL